MAILRLRKTHPTGRQIFRTVSDQPIDINTTFDQVIPDDEVSDAMRASPHVVIEADAPVEEEPKKKAKKSEE